MRPSSDFTGRIGRLLLVALVGVVWPWLPVMALQNADAPRHDASHAAPDPKRTADTLERVFQALEAADKATPRDTFDPAAIVESVGRDPAKLFEWVRDQTHWVPYRGALRGPVGVLMDRVGSSLDRALLMAELLRIAGHNVRLMHASLTDEQAETVRAGVRPLPQNWLSAVADKAEASDERAVAYAQQFGIDAAMVKSAAAEATRRNASAAEETARRITTQVPAISEALARGEAEPPQAEAVKAATESITEAIKDHWWVAVHQGDSWENLDPALPGAKPGQVAAAGATGEPLAYEGKLPDDPALCHEVQITLSIQRWTGGKLEEHPVLSHTLRPADVLGKRVAIGHVPTRWPNGEDLLGAADGAERFRKIAAEQQEWAPVLAVGAEQFIQKGFTSTGRIVDSPALNPIARTGVTQGQKVGGSTGLLGGLPGGADDEPEAKDDGRLTAQWIDYEIRVPGREPVTVRRELFDVRGPGAPSGEQVPAPNLSPPQVLDRSLRMMGQTEILLQPCAATATYLGHVAARAALSNRAAILSLLRREKPDPAFLEDQAKKVISPPGAVYALAWARFNWSPVRGEVYLGAPNVLSQHQYLRSGPKETLVSVEAFDIVSNTVAVRQAGDADTSRLTRLKQGVADTAAEAGVLRRVDKHGTLGPLENASELHAAGGAWVTLRGRDDPALRKLSVPRDVRIRIEKDLADGFVVIAPQRVPTGAGSQNAAAAWWRVDPETGQTLGIGRHGWGLAVTEEQLQMVNLAVQIASAMKCLYSHRGDHDIYTLGCIALGGIGVAGVFASGTLGQLLSIIGTGGGLSL